MTNTAIPNPVLKEARRLIDFYESDESNPDKDTSLRLTAFAVRSVDDDRFVIECESVEIHGVEVTDWPHDDTEILSGSGELLSHISDGVEQR